MCQLGWRSGSCACLEVDGGGASVEIFKEGFERAFWFVGVELCGWGEDAVLGVMGDFGDEFSCGVCGSGFGQVEAGDLQAVEKETGAARVDLVGGDAAQDFADGLLDGGAVFRVGEREAGLRTRLSRCAAKTGHPVARLDGAARVVMEVAETFGTFGAAKGRAAAAAAVGKDVAALEASGLGVGGEDFRCHVCGDPLPGVFAQNPGLM